MVYGATLPINSSPQLSSEAEGEIMENIYLSCVKTLREHISDLPTLDAIDWPINTITPVVGDIVKMKYLSNYHIALITNDLGDSWEIYQGNIPTGATSTEVLLKSDEKILGYYNHTRQQMINSLDKDLKDLLWCESRWSHYDENGSVLRGKDGEFGVGQFMKPTWGWFNDLRIKQGLRMIDYMNFEHQIEMLKWAKENKKLNQWSCYSPGIVSSTD